MRHSFASHYSCPHLCISVYDVLLKAELSIYVMVFLFLFTLHSAYITGMLACTEPTPILKSAEQSKYFSFQCTYQVVIAVFLFYVCTMFKYIGIKLILGYIAWYFLYQTEKEFPFSCFRSAPELQGYRSSHKALVTFSYITFTATKQK